MGFTYQMPAIVGGTVLVLERIESQNYKPGLAGWAIMADGSAEFANLVARGSLVGGLIEINGLTYPNAIALFTGNPDEIAPAVIEPDTSGNNGTVRFSSPVLKVGATPATLDLSGFDDGHNSFELDVDVLRITAGTGGVIEATGLKLSGDFDTYISLASGYAQVEGETWHDIGASGEPPFAGNWAVNTATPVAFYKDATGRVQLRGRAQETVALSTTMFTLPAGYRPSQTMSWAVKANNDGTSIGWVSVSTTGVVQGIGNLAGLRVQTIFDVISFPTL